MCISLTSYHKSYYVITEAFQSTSGSISGLINGINSLKDTGPFRNCYILKAQLTE